MPQTTSSLTLEIRPACVARVRQVLEAWRNSEELTPDLYAGLKTRLPGLHFMSATVFSDASYDPILALEFNFDGRPDAFWRQLEAAHGAVLQDLIRCCKRPVDRTCRLFDAALRPGAHPPVAAYLAAQAGRPLAVHQGNRGLDRERIEQEAALFLETRRVLANAKEFAGATPAEIHAKLRAALLPGFPWLNGRAPPRITVRERLCDGAKLAGAQLLLVLGLSLPGVLLSFLDARLLLLGFFLAGAALATGIYFVGGAVSTAALRQAGAELTLLVRHALPWLANRIVLFAAAVLLLAGFVLAGATVIAILTVVVERRDVGSAWVYGVRAAVLGLASMMAAVPLLLLWLRWLEVRDPSQDGPPTSPESLKQMAEAEDQVVQNHMSSLVLIKPGILRAALIRVGLWNVGLILRTLATDGYLASMRTIHFAHWTLASNGGRLLFFSNFDGSWESYLDDFIEKAHGGLSLAWGNCVGFPPSCFLVLGGASQGRQFKAWARHSMAPALFWFSAYPNDTVNQIERQAALAEGLRRPTLNEEEATAWMRTL